MSDKYITVPHNGKYKPTKCREIAVETDCLYCGTGHVVTMRKDGQAEETYVHVFQDNAFHSPLSSRKLFLVFQLMEQAGLTKREEQ